MHKNPNFRTEGGAKVVIIAIRASEFKSLYLEVSEDLDLSIFVPTEAVLERADARSDQNMPAYSDSNANLSQRGIVGQRKV